MKAVTREDVLRDNLIMAKRREPCSFSCPACGVGQMTPGSHGHRCNKCSHFENDPSTYNAMERDRGEDLVFCHCTFCSTKGAEKNHPVK